MSSLENAKNKVEKEKEIVKKLKNKLQILLKDFNVDIKPYDNLIYRVIVNENLEYEPENPKEPKRGKKGHAFQKDLVITNKNGYPLVAIEIKKKNPTTHEILAYSAKAQKHKEIYPNLRYGLVIVRENKVDRRFFIHNFGFDFAYALENLEDKESIKKLGKIIAQQIKNSEFILKVLKEKVKVKSLNTIIEGDES